MTRSRMSDEELLLRLNADVTLRSRVESILELVGDDAGDLKRADDAELRTIDEVRRLGQEVMTAWATRQVERTTRSALEGDQVARQGKKNCAGTAPSER